MSTPASRKAAFTALLPLANLTAAALDRVDRRVDEERKLMQPLRSAWTPTQFAASYGLSRFNYGVLELGAAWETHSTVKRVSSEAQELGQVFLWTVGPSWILRVKHEPAEGAGDGVQQLFAQDDLDIGPKQLFLSWGVSTAGSIVRPLFMCLDNPGFIIPLTQLLEVANRPPQPLRPSKPRARVRSTRPAQRDAERDES
jgi:hypothetical protein